MNRLRQGKGERLVNGQLLVRLPSILSSSLPRSTISMLGRLLRGMVAAPPSGPEWIGLLGFGGFGALQRGDGEFRFGKW
jgi:hypothetical protein